MSATNREYLVRQLTYYSDMALREWAAYGDPEKRYEAIRARVLAAKTLADPDPFLDLPLRPDKIKEMDRFT